MKVITTEENILEALDAAYYSGWCERGKMLYEHAAGMEVKKPPDDWGNRQRAFESNLKLMDAVGKAISSNAQGLGAIASLVDNLNWRHG